MIQSIAAHDEGAMRTLYERYNTYVFRFIARIVKDEHLAEDITSEVFFEVWRQADKFGARSQVSIWILAIARFKAWSANRVWRHLSLDAAKAEQIPDRPTLPRRLWSNSTGVPPFAPSWRKCHLNIGKSSILSTITRRP
jgi:RNA polymerase sigma-70 factor (ECF subfamily)